VSEATPCAFHVPRFGVLIVFDRFAPRRRINKLRSISSAGGFESDLCLGPVLTEVLLSAI
jgi:hypothetical protein